MKQLLAFFALLISLSGFSQGSFDETGRLKPDGNYPIVHSIHLKGGIHPFLNAAQRDTLPLNFKDEGMLAYTTVDSSYWRWTGSQWAFLFRGGNVGNQNLQQVTSIDSITNRNIIIGGARFKGSADTICFIGNSISAGFQVLPLSNRWTTRSCQQIGAYEVNIATSGIVLQRGTPLPTQGSFLDSIYKIPNYYSGNYYVNILIGTNDILRMGTFTPAGYSIALNQLIDSILIRGHSANRIILNTVNYLTNYGGGGSSQARHLVYNDTIRAVAGRRGVILFDMYNYMLQSGGAALLQSDGVHINSFPGNAVMAAGYASMFKTAQVVRGDQTVLGTSTSQGLHVDSTITVNGGNIPARAATPGLTGWLYLDSLDQDGAGRWKLKRLFQVPFVTTDNIGQTINGQKTFQSATIHNSGVVANTYGRLNNTTRTSFTRSNVDANVQMQISTANTTVSTAGLQAAIDFGTIDTVRMSAIRNTEYASFRFGQFIDMGAFPGASYTVYVDMPDTRVLNQSNHRAFGTNINSTKGFAFHASGTAPVYFNGYIQNPGIASASSADTLMPWMDVATKTYKFRTKTESLGILGALSSSDTGFVNKTTEQRFIYGKKRFRDSLFTANIQTYGGISATGNINADVVLNAGVAVQAPAIIAAVSGGGGGEVFFSASSNGVAIRNAAGTPSGKVYQELQINKAGTIALLSNITDSLNARAADPMNGALPPVTVTDANYSMSAPSFAILPTPTANRTVTLPNATTYGGRILIIWNRNTSGANGWTFASTVWDKSGNTIVNLTTTTFYRLISDGTRWVIFP